MRPWKDFGAVSVHMLLLTQLQDARAMLKRYRTSLVGSRWNS